MRAWLRWAAFAGVLAVSLGVAYGAYVLAGTAWDSVVNYRSPYADLDVLPAPAGQPLSDRVVLVIVDGLRLDAARQMRTLNRLGDFAADFVLTAPQPSLSYPNWTTILSGASPYVSGVVTNWHEGAAPVDTLLDSAEKAGVPYVVVGPSDIATLYPAAARADGSYFEQWSEEYLASTYVDATIKLVAEKNPRLVVLHIPDVDEAGHGSGGASAEYGRTVARVDDDLRRLVEGVETSATTFVIVADHGHIDTGGHGGWEQEATKVRGILAGKGASLAEGTGALEDVAPTVALLAGIPVPGHSTGEVLASAIATSALSAGAREAKAQEVEFATLRATTMLGPDADPATRAQVLALTERDPKAGIAAADQYRQAKDRSTRWPYGAAMAGAALLAIARDRPRLLARAGRRGCRGGDVLRGLQRPVLRGAREPVVLVLVQLGGPDQLVDEPAHDRGDHRGSGGRGGRRTRLPDAP